MKWSTSRKKIFFVDSKEDCRCPCCGSELKYRDQRLRVHKVAGGAKEWYLVRRLKCTNDNVGNLLVDDRARYVYDAFNRTERVETFDGHVQVNRYDAENLRHELEEDGKLVQFIYRGDGLNLYIYCRNNPVSYVDPSGHWCDQKEQVYQGLLKREGLTADTVDPDTQLRLMAEAANQVKEKSLLRILHLNCLILVRVVVILLTLN